MQNDAQRKQGALAAERQRVRERQTLISAQRDAIMWAVTANAQLCRKLPNERVRGEAVLRHQLVPAVRFTHQAMESSRGRITTCLGEFAQLHAEVGDAALVSARLEAQDEQLVGLATALHCSPWQSADAFLRALCETRETLDRERDRSMVGDVCVSVCGCVDVV
jgi:hypothetical protein